MKKISVVDFPEEITESGVKIYGETSLDNNMAVLSQYLHNGFFDTADTGNTEEVRNDILIAIRDYFDSLDIEDGDKKFDFEKGVADDWAMSPFFSDFFKVPCPDPEPHNFTFIDLFAGMGGFRLAMQAQKHILPILARSRLVT